MKQDGSVISCKGMDADPVFLHFISDDIGYAFGNIGEMYSQSDAIIYQTIDGGKNWKKINSIADHLFTGSTSLLVGNNIYCNIKSATDMATNRIVCFSSHNNVIKTLDCEIKATGDIWEQNGKIFSNIYTDSGYSLLVSDTYLSRYSTQKFKYRAKANGVCCDNNHVYFLTHDGQLLIQTCNCIKRIPVCNPQCFAKIKEGELLIVANTAKNLITLYEYSADSNQIREVQTIPGYNIAKCFYVDEVQNQYVGFVGNISGDVVKHDMIYGSINDHHWEIKKLYNAYSIAPNARTKKKVFILSDRHTLQKMPLTEKN